jgi:hypothetical protein
MVIASETFSMRLNQTLAAPWKMSTLEWGTENCIVADECNKSHETLLD